MAPAKKQFYRSALLSLGFLGVCSAFALEVDDVRVTEIGGMYTAQLAFDVMASVEKVRAILTDYEQADQLTSGVDIEKVAGQQNGRTRVRTEIKGCILFLCKNLTMTQDVTVSRHFIRADIIPQESDFQSGYQLWLLTQTDSGAAHIEYQSVLVPDFLMPPFIGSILVRRRLREQIFKAAENLEREAGST